MAPTNFATFASVSARRLLESPNVKVCLVLGFCFTAALLFLSRSSDSTPEVRLSANMPSDEPQHVQVPGGLGPIKQADDTVKSVVEEIKPKLEAKIGKLASLDVLHYKTQVVAGTNYWVKAKAKPVDGDEQIVHLRIYQNLKRELELTAHQVGKTLEDAIDYFQ